MRRGPDFHIMSLPHIHFRHGHWGPAFLKRLFPAHHGNVRGGEAFTCESWFGGFARSLCRKSAPAGFSCRSAAQSGQKCGEIPMRRVGIGPWPIRSGGIAKGEVRGDFAFCFTAMLTLPLTHSPPGQISADGEVIASHVVLQTGQTHIEVRTVEEDVVDMKLPEAPS